MSQVISLSLSHVAYFCGIVRMCSQPRPCWSRSALPIYTMHPESISTPSCGPTIVRRSARAAGRIARGQGPLPSGLASPALPTRLAAPPARLGPPSTRPGPGLGVGGAERGLTFQPSRKTPRVLVLVLDLRPPHAGWLRKILVHSPELLVVPLPFCPLHAPPLGQRPQCRVIDRRGWGLAGNLALARP